jgi:hypothetical protein
MDKKRGEKNVLLMNRKSNQCEQREASCMSKKAYE